MEIICVNKFERKVIYMDLNNMKNTIVLKNLPSNMVQEAYVVFKDNVKIHKIDNVEKNKKQGSEAKNKEYMVKEAEMIIKDYISKIEHKEYELGTGNRRLKEKYKRLKALTVFLAIFSSLSLIIAIF